MTEKIYLPYRPSTGTAKVQRVNVGATERVIAGVLGTAAVRRVKSRQSLAGKALTVAWGAMLLRRAATGRSRMYRVLGIDSTELAKGAGINIDVALTVRRPREELFELWHDVTNLPLILTHVSSVELNDDGISHWKVKGPRGLSLEWDSAPLNERRPEYVAWRSVPGSQVEHAGSLHFFDAGEYGTEMILRLRYVPPGNAPGFLLAKVLNPVTQAQVMDDLRRFKRIIESGVDITTDGQPSGPKDGGGGR
jgi:uncharacterized membrane protein